MTHTWVTSPTELHLHKTSLLTKCDVLLVTCMNVSCHTHVRVVSRVQTRQTNTHVGVSCDADEQIVMRFKVQIVWKSFPHQISIIMIMYTYIYIYTFIYTYKYVYVFIFTHTYMYLHIYISIHLIIYIYMCIYMKTYTYIYIYMKTYTYIHEYR